MSLVCLFHWRSAGQSKAVGHTHIKGGIKEALPTYTVMGREWIFAKQEFKLSTEPWHLDRNIDGRIWNILMKEKKKIIVAVNANTPTAICLIAAVSSLSGSKQQPPGASRPFQDGKCKVIAPPTAGGFSTHFNSNFNSNSSCCCCLGTPIFLHVIVHQLPAAAIKNSRWVVWNF